MHKKVHTIIYNWKILLFTKIIYFIIYLFYIVFSFTATAIKQEAAYIKPNEWNMYYFYCFIIYKNGTEPNIVVVNRRITFAS